MITRGSGLNGSRCVKALGQGKAGTRKAIATAAMVVAVCGAGFLSGCAGVVISSNPATNSGSPNPISTPTPTQAKLSASPVNASFPNVMVGSTNSQTLTLLNSGNASAAISSVRVNGAGFGTSGLSLPLVLAAGQSSTFNVTFTANASGDASGSILLASNAPNSPLTISLSGTAIAVSRLLGSNPASLNFGNVTLGSSNVLVSTLTNNGNANVTISSVSVSGAGFLISGVGANALLAPGQSAELSTTFAPTAVGNASGTITVVSDASDVVTLALSGAGVQVGSHTVALTWDASTSAVVGYFVYRQTGTGGTFAKLNIAPIVLTQFTDNNVQDGQSYTYVVTAIDADNVESDYSDPAEAIIPTS